MAPVKYKSDSYNLRDTFEKKKVAYGEINERGFSKPNNWSCDVAVILN